ncbi:putative aldouronate transport system substrate-binding protein [Fontibacillus phaseoli]|uniref:Putative aldouronate transport system substrate-binding protein n=1 Tax=Fontibacillus phaseoli TaxID=1416533 RepID=A0A369BFT0_9BACL|nr:ABC transporter substrate-binding protein [Fontibacillus phaseoli]RCX18554.1 putative aldouronate transport system substrate-binding protein [Fontibacillus phaseoli]
MRSLNKNFGILLLASMLLVSAGCGNSGNKTVNSGDSTRGDDTSPISFTFFGADANPNWNNMQDEVGKEITAKTGVTIDAEFDIGSGGGQDKISMMAASGDYPDLIFAKGELGKLVDTEAILDLTDLIEEHAPNIKKIMSENMNRMKYSNEDQAIYAIPTNIGVDQQYFDATNGFQVQHRVLKELGYPEIKTINDFENVLREYAEKHPTTDGQPTIPLTLNADGWKMLITVTNQANNTTGGMNDGEYHVDPETYEAMLHYKRPVEREYFRWLNKLYNDGLLDKDSFVQKEDQYKAKIASGRVLGLTSVDWEYAEAENALKAAGKYEYTYAHFPVTLSEEYKDHAMQSFGVDGYGISITTACKDPVRAIKFLDWLASDEGQVLRNWGIEGKQYIVENGTRVIPADVLNKKVNDANTFAKETGVDLYTTFAPRYGDGVKDSTGNYYTTNFPEQIIAKYSDVEKETLAAYKAKTWKELFPSEDELPVKEWGALYNMQVPTDGEYQVISKKTQDIVQKRIPEAILTKADKFDQVYDDFLAELDKVGAEKMEKEYTELVKARVSLFTGKNIE